MKKKITYLVLLTSIFFVDISVKAANIFGDSSKKDVCGLSLPSNVPTFTSGLFNLVKILVPIILIVMGMVDFAKAVMANDEKKMKESTTTFIRRLIAAVFIFFIVAVVQFVFKKVSSDNGFASCMNCVLRDDCAVSTEDYISEINSIKDANKKTTSTTANNNNSFVSSTSNAKSTCEALTKKTKCRLNNVCEWNSKTKKCKAKQISSTLTKKSTTNEESSSSEQEKIVAYAKKYATENPNHPYVYGGTSLCKTTPYNLSRGCKVDCSGFVQQVYAHNGYKCIPRTSQQQASSLGKKYDENVKLQKGDLLFFYSDLHHVGIYIGNGKYVHASTEKVGVIVSNINSNKPIQKYARVIGNSNCKKS